MRARIALLTLALATLGAMLFGCAGRERANPFDPENQTTGGRPSGFMALAREGRADLVWQTPGTAGLVGFQLWRRTAYETDYHPLSAVLGPDVTSYTDRGLLDGLDHLYRLYFVFGSGTGADPSEDTATPGPQIPWVADGAGALLEVTADGRHVAVRHGGLARPTSVAVDTSTRRVWCSDPDAGVVRILEALSGITITVPVSGTPGGIALVPGDSTAWICQEDAGAVVHLAPGGQVLERLNGLQLPIGVAVSGADGSLWVCERDGSRVLHRDTELGDLGSVALPAPSRVAVDAVTGEAWVSSFTHGTVWKLSPAGATLATVGAFAGPVGIAVDATRGNIWVADAAGDRVRVLAPDGRLRFEVGSVPGARSVVVDPVTGEGWVAAVASGELVRISPVGVVIRRLGGIGSANDVALMP